MRTVLVIDDEPQVRAVLEETLEGLGFSVVVAIDGPTGLGALETSEPDLVLVDFAMPGMNGTQVADRIRKLRPDLPIVFATGYSDTAAIEDAVGSAALLLKKPFRIADLETMLVRALGEEQPATGLFQRSAAVVTI